MAKSRQKIRGCETRTKFRLQENQQSVKYYLLSSFRVFCINVLSLPHSAVLLPDPRLNEIYAVGLFSDVRCPGATNLTVAKTLDIANPA